MLYRAIGILLGLLMLALSWRAHLENKEFEKYALTSYIEPIRKYTETTTKSVDKNGIVWHEWKANSVDAFYLNADRERIRISRKIPKLVVTKLISGELVQVTYLPNKQDAVRFEGEAGKPLNGSLVGILLLLVSFIPWQRRY